MQNEGKLQKVVLASRSPRRIALLKQIGVESIVRPADIDESVQQDELPSDYVQRLAREKALAVAGNIEKQYAHLIVLAADTTVSVGQDILGKPETDAAAVTMLNALSGTTHAVHTAVAVCLGETEQTILNTTSVEMMPLSRDEIDAYIATGEHRDKAGSYGIQGRAAAWIKHIAGSYSGVMGLPLHETAQLMRTIVATQR